MVRKTEQICFYLDKVERKKLQEIKEKNPEYEDLKLYQVAHLELKTHLFKRVRELIASEKHINKVASTPSYTTALWCSAAAYLLEKPVLCMMET